MSSVISWLRKKVFRKVFKKEKPARFYRQRTKFIKRYPNYIIGEGSYGIPIVHDWNEGSTLIIGAYCSFADNVQIFLGGQHRMDWVSQYPFPAFWPGADHIRDFGGTHGSVEIGSDVWIGGNVTILSGVKIAHGAVIGSGALVSKDVEAYEIVAGNPAKHIRFRFAEDIRNKLLATCWWEWDVEEVLSRPDIFCSDDLVSFFEYVDRREPS